MAAPRRLVFGPVEPTASSIDKFGLPTESDVEPLPPPTGGIDEGAPVGIPPQDTERAAVYHAKRPAPPYSKIKPDFVDPEGRQYQVAKEGDFLEEVADTVDNAQYTDPPTDKSRSLGRLLLWVRMPISLRHEVDNPTGDGTRLELYHPATQVLSKVVVESAFIEGTMSSGYVFVSEMESTGRVREPEAYEKWMQQGREPGAQWF